MYLTMCSIAQNTQGRMFWSTVKDVEGVRGLV